MLLAAIGIYGVIAYLVGAARARDRHPHRARRVAVARGAHGGERGRGDGRDRASASAVVGAMALTQLMRALLFNTKSTDPMTYILVTLVLAAVALVASSVPALRAANVDPALAMRAE